MPEFSHFTTQTNEAYVAHGAMAPFQSWSAFDVPRSEAEAGNGSRFFMSLWNELPASDPSGPPVPVIRRDIATGTYWYEVKRDNAGMPIEPQRTALWNAIGIAERFGLQMTGLLKDLASGRFSLTHTFSIDRVVRDVEPGVIWLKITPADPADIGCVAEELNLAHAAGFIEREAEVEARFAGALEASLKRTHEARLERLKNASPTPRKVTVTTTAFERNADVVAEALFRAEGVCGGCGEDAPFFRDRSGEPYLEVHHIVPLAKGGDDTVENAIALCPNCHRDQHYGRKPRRLASYP